MNQMMKKCSIMVLSLISFSCGMIAQNNADTTMTEIEDLEERLKGVILDNRLAKKLEELDLGEYMAGISPQELAQLIRG